MTFLYAEINMSCVIKQIEKDIFRNKFLKNNCLQDASINNFNQFDNIKLHL